MRMVFCPQISLRIMCFQQENGLVRKIQAAVGNQPQDLGISDRICNGGSEIQ